MLKKSSTLFLKIVILLISVLTFAGLVWFPQTEGRAANLDLISIYTDPVILYAYFGSVPFFFGLYQAFKLLNLIDMNKAFSGESVKTLRNMKYAALALIAFIIGAEIFLFIFGVEDDKAGPAALGFYLIFVTSILATASAVFQKLFQNAVDIKEENDLTV